jgi:hypothetical protein
VASIRELRLRIEIKKTPFCNDDLTPESLEALTLVDGVWREACRHFVAIRASQRQSGSITLFGIQKTINQVLTERFTEAGWLGTESRFRKNTTWVRFTFRHQMSVGSEILDAIKVSNKEGISQCFLISAPNDFLKIISPKDAGSLTSYEKIVNELATLENAISVPLILGALVPNSVLPSNVRDEVYGPRLNKS